MSHIIVNGSTPAQQLNTEKGRRTLATACGHHLWDWAFPHGSRKQPTQLTVWFSTFLRPQPLLGLIALQCGRSALLRRSVLTDKLATPQVQLRACSSKRRSGVGTNVVDVESHIRHALHHLLADQLSCQWVRWVVISHALQNQCRLQHF